MVNQMNKLTYPDIWMLDGPNTPMVKSPDFAEDDTNKYKMIFEIGEHRYDCYM